MKVDEILMTRTLSQPASLTTRRDRERNWHESLTQVMFEFRSRSIWPSAYGKRLVCAHSHV